MDPSALGRYLRESRESKELTLEDAVRALRIRRDILESFEQGEFNVMDSTVRVRGMLRNYAHYLGLEEDRVLQYYEAANNNKRRRRFGRRESYAEPIAPRKITDTPPSLPKVIVPQVKQSSGLADALRNLAMVLVSLAAVAVIAFVIVDRLELGTPDSERAPEPTILTGSVTVTPTNTPTITPRATVITDTPNPLVSNIGIVGVQVLVEMQQRSWVRIQVDDVEQYVGVLEPGYVVTYTANETVTITAANAAALDIEYNGVQQDPFGARGQEVVLVFTTTGLDIQQGESVITPISETPVEAINSPEASQLPTTEATAQVQVTNTPIISGIATPTPLFPVANSNENDTANNASVSDSASETPATNNPSASSTDLPQQATASPTITNTPTSAAVLPLRQTPANLTATKTG